MSAALGFVSEISEIIEYDGKLMEKYKSWRCQPNFGLQTFQSPCKSGKIENTNHKSQTYIIQPNFGWEGPKALEVSQLGSMGEVEKKVGEVGTSLMMALNIF